MKKTRLLIALLAAVLLVGILPAMAAGSPTLEVATVTAQAGETVDVEIAVKNNPGIASINIDVTIDPALTLTGVVYNSAIGGQFVPPQTMNSPVTLNWVSPFADAEGDWTFATLTFSVAEDAPAGTYPITVTYDPDDLYDMTETNIDFAVVNGGVEVPAEEVEATNIRFEIKDGVPYLCWDAPENALDGLIYHVMFDYKYADGEDDCCGWPVNGLKTELCDMEPAEYTAIRVITELDGMNVAEVEADVTLTVSESDDLKAKLMIQNNENEQDDLFLFSGLTPNGKFRFEALTDAENPDGSSFSNELESEANGTCENGNGSWFMEEYGNGVYRIVEAAAALDENGNLTVSNRSTGWKNIQDAIAVPAAPKTEDITISEKLELNEEQAGEVTDAAANVTVDLVEENANVKDEELANLTDKAGNKVEITEETIVKVTEITLKIEVTEYRAPVQDEETGEMMGDPNANTLKLDITPVATVTVSRETVNEETGETESEPIATKTGAEVDTTGTPVVVTIPLPKGFADHGGQTLYVIHTKDGEKGEKYTHRVETQWDGTWNDGTDRYYISFVNSEGFSDFEVTKQVAELTWTENGETQSQFCNNLWDALNNARDRVNEDCTDVTVKVLLDNLEEGQLFVTNGVTLDLNGKTLNAGYVAAFNGSHIVDNSAEKTGLLKVEKTNIMLSKDNSQMPVWNGKDGYVFAAMRYALRTTTNTDDAMNFMFKPQFGAVIAEYVKTGVENSAVSIVVRFTWENGDNDAKQDFIYNDAMMAQVYATGSTKGFTLSVSGLEQLENLSVEVMVLSETGAIWSKTIR